MIKKERMTIEEAQWYYDNLKVATICYGDYGYVEMTDGED